ncbi:MAG: HEAT repeat domain-containing protein, partial [Candidatus Pacearchaeota archaeon]|nr:HEAT repeat domain-containing protein [Candidatus Pacearchaeota archaeon]
MSIILITIFSLFFTSCSTHKTSSISNKLLIRWDTLYIDQCEIEDTIIEPIYFQDSLFFATTQFEENLNNTKVKNIDLNKYLRFLFIYRDEKILPLLYRIITDSTYHNFHKIKAIYAIGEISSISSFDFLLEYWKNDNALIREYIASALGKTGNNGHVEILEGLLKNESDFYVHKTLESAIRFIRNRKRKHVKYLPKYDSSGLLKLDFYPNISTQGTKNETYSTSTNSSLNNLLKFKNCVA